MTRTSRALKRLGVAGVALVTIGAGMPALLATSASAAVATSITITPSTQSGATGTCQVFTIQALDANGGAPDTGTVTVELTDPSGNDAANATTADDSAQFCVAASNTSPTFTANSSTLAVTGATNRRTAQVTTDSTGKATFGIVDSQEETVSVRAFTGADRTFDPNTEAQSAAASAVFTPGSGTNTPNPSNQTAADNARTLTEVPQDADDPTTVAGGSQVIQVVVKNTAGDEVAGATPRYVVQSGGANSAGTTGNATAPTGTCSVSNNAGVSTCTVPVANAGSDKVLVFLNQTTGTTTGADAGEPQVVVTRTTATAPSTDATTARNVDLTPEGPATAPSGTDRTFSARVTDVTGRAVQGVTVTFSEDGLGFLVGAGSAGTVTAVTNNLGVATAVLRSADGATGQSVVSASLPSTGNQCAQAAGTPAGSTAGNCTDSEVTNFVVASASPSPSASAPASPSASASPTASTSPTTAPSSPAASSSPTGGNVACPATPPTVTFERSTIIATGSTGVTVSGAPANSTIDLLAYSQPSRVFRVVRSAEINASATPAQFRIVPPTNTRVYAQVRGCTTDAARYSVVLNVRTQLSLNVVRNGTRNYTFSGRALPARPGGLIVSLYRVTDERSSDPDRPGPRQRVDRRLQSSTASSRAAAASASSSAPARTCRTRLAPPTSVRSLVF